MISTPENYMLLFVAVVSFLALTSQSLFLIPRGGCIPYARDIDNALRDFRISTSSAAASLDPEYGRVVDWFGLLEPLFPSLSFLSMILRPEDFDTLGLLTSSYFSLVVMFAVSFLFVFYLVQVAAGEIYTDTSCIILPNFLTLLRTVPSFIFKIIHLHIGHN